MLTPSYVIRNYSPDDFERFMEFLNDAYMDMYFPDRWESAPQFFQQKQGFPGYSPEKHLFLADWKGKIVGYADISPEPQIGRVILNGLVSVYHRREGVANKMMKSTLARAAKLGFKIAHVCVSEKNAAARGLLSGAGFSAVRHLHELEIGLKDMPEEDFDWGTLEISSLLPGEEALLTQAQNRCFTGTWGFCPNTVEEVVYYFSLTGSTPKDVLVAKEEERIVGYCWTNLIVGWGKRNVQKKGRVHMLGVDPDYRRKGIGKNLLKAGLYYLKRREADAVELTADKGNADAYALYRSLGFQMKSVNLWYEKRLK